MALSAWGTSNMRTGGDDIAQAMALIGVQPSWETGSGRVTGFEIIPGNVLGRPRVDVTLRISGFFRDAFPGLIGRRRPGVWRRRRCRPVVLTVHRLNSRQGIVSSDQNRVLMGPVCRH